jgi:hypothetical protein
MILSRPFSLALYKAKSASCKSRSGLSDSSGNITIPTLDATSYSSGMAICLFVNNIGCEIHFLISCAILIALAEAAS